MLDKSELAKFGIYGEASVPVCYCDKADGVHYHLGDEIKTLLDYPKELIRNGKIKLIT